jgi:hypothetical protein
MTHLFPKTMPFQQMLNRTRRHARSGRKQRHWTFLERLEDRIAPAGIVNGDFSVSNPADPGYGWTTLGNASIANNNGILDEGTAVQTEFSQTFTIAPGTQVLRFTIVSSNLVTNGTNNPPDAFEAALLNATTMDPLVGPPTGLSNTDSFLNIQQTGEVFYAPQVTVPGAGPSGSVATLDFPNTVSVDVSSVPANTEATVFFDLIGFSPATSEVKITNVLALESTTQPTANAQSVATPENTAAAITLSGADPNIPPLPLTYSVTTSPTHGTLSGKAPNLTYTPDSGYLGADSFQFTNANGTATSSPATVSINVVGTPTANPQTVTTAQDTAAPITLAGTDPDTPPLPLTFVVTTAPSHGTLSGTAPDLTYTPTSGYFGADSFQFTAGNGTATSPAATVSIGVVGTPAANAQSLTTGESTALPVTLTGSDPNTPRLPLTFIVTAAPSHGTLTGTAPALTYTPDSGFFGSDSFQFTAGNGTATSAAATVSINVGSPTANAQSVTTAENTPAAITLTGSDPNTPPLSLTFTVTISPAHGALSGTAPNLTYTPDAGYVGADSLEFTASNGSATSAPAIVSITVAGAPTANAQSVTTAENTAAAITLTGSDPNTPPLPLTFTVTVSPAHGTLSGTAPDLTYTPASGYFGADSFQFTASNGTLTSPAATVSINVVRTPTANAQSVTTAEGVAAPITLTGSDPNTPALPLTFSVTTAPSHGTLSRTAPDVTYAPASGYFGADSFQFTTKNGTATSPPATVSIDVVGTPTANAQSVTTAENTAKAITLTGSDPNTPPLPLTFTVTVSPTHGTLTGTSPNFTYTPTSGYIGADSFQFTANNGSATSAPATVSINVVGTPTANAQSVTTAENTAAAITLTGSDPNTPPLALTFTVTVNPAHGTLSGTAPNLTYTPTSGYSGGDSFTFQVSNGTVESTLATVSLTITPSSNQAPITVGSSYATAQNHTLTVAAPGVLTGVVSTGPIAPTAVLVSGPNHGSLDLDPDGAFTYTPAQNFTGNDSFSFQGVAGAALGNVSVVQMSVRAIPVRLLPDTPFFNYVRARRALDPARFDTWHPRIGAIIEMELSGIPTTPTVLVSVNHHFDAPALRAIYNRNPARFDAKSPILGALFQLETPASGPPPIHLLPDTPHYNALRAQFAEDPEQFGLRQVYLGAIFTLEDIENGVTPTASAATVNARAVNVKVGVQHPVPAWRFASSSRGLVHAKLAARVDTAWARR